MDSLRRAPLLARLMLAWFAFTLCIGVAASVRDPLALAGICSVGDRSASTSSSPDGDAGGGMANHGAHCLLCISPGVPSSAAPMLVLPTVLGDPPSRWVAAPAPVLRAFGPPAARAPPTRA
ncbi:MAG: DUF2946 family protein [Burkholderiales bacterium]